MKYRGLLMPRLDERTADLCREEASHGGQAFEGIVGSFARIMLAVA
jgi:hypothetical protein